jgi:hypothetical protein
MTISSLLFAFESELADYVDAGYLGESAEPTRQAVVDLLGHVHAVLMLPGLDQQPDRPVDRVTAASAWLADSGDDWDQQD